MYSCGILREFNAASLCKDIESFFMIVTYLIFFSLFHNLTNNIVCRALNESPLSHFRVHKAGQSVLRDRKRTDMDPQDVNTEAPNIKAKRGKTTKKM